jgi:hypothetical protein
MEHQEDDVRQHSVSAGQDSGSANQGQRHAPTTTVASNWVDLVIHPVIP